MPDFETNLYLDILLHHSLNRLYIENPKSAALGSHGIQKLTKQKLLSIVKVKTSFDSFFRVEELSQWCRLFVSTRSACGHQKRSAETQGHQIRLAQRKKINSEGKRSQRVLLLINISRKYLSRNGRAQWLRPGCSTTGAGGRAQWSQALVPAQCQVQWSQERAAGHLAAGHQV